MPIPIFSYNRYRYQYFYQHRCRYRYGPSRYRYDQIRYRYICIGIGQKYRPTDISVNLYIIPPGNSDIMHRLILGKTTKGEEIKDWKNECWDGKCNKIIKTFLHIVEYEKVKEFHYQLYISQPWLVGLFATNISCC